MLALIQLGGRPRVQTADRQPPRLQSQYDLAMLERKRGKEILRQVRPAGAAI